MSTTPTIPQGVSTPVTPQATNIVPQPLPWWVSFAINSGIVAIHQVLHNPHQAATLHDVLIQLRDAINATYPGE